MRCRYGLFIVPGSADCISSDYFGNSGQNFVLGTVISDIPAPHVNTHTNFTKKRLFRSHATVDEKNYKCATFLTRIISFVFLDVRLTSGRRVAVLIL